MLLRRLSLALLLALPVFAFAAPLSVDPASVRIEVEARATMHGFTGRLAKADVALETTPAGDALAAASVRFAWSDLKTGDKARDREMLAWATARSPDGAFLLLELEPTSGPDTYTASGSLSLNGETRDIAFPVKIARDAAGWSLSGETRIDHRDWGLPKIRKFGFLTVDPVVAIRFSLTASTAKE